MAKRRKGVYARDIDRMNILFALVSIVSMLTVLWMIYDDYARPWKKYQRQFQVIQSEVTQEQLANEQAGIDQQRRAEVTTQRDQAEQAVQDQRDQIDQIEAELGPVQTRLGLAEQNLRFARSTYDTRRWEFEEARKHNGEEGSASERAAMEAAEADRTGYAAEVEELTIRRDDLQGQIDPITGAVSAGESEIVEMTREIDRLRDRLDSLRFNWVYYLRNAPFMDGFNASERINQVVLDNVRFDLNFTDAPQVDRCESCHLGIGSAEFEAYDQPFKSHPNLDLYVADNAIHPMGEFGCTVCHGGKGHATSFATAVHTPDNDSEMERWEHDLDWEHVELWEWPMRPSDEIESGCLKCHLTDTWIPDAPDLEYGLRLMERLGCYGCHQLDRWDGLRKRGPDLAHISVKTTPDWAYKWVMNPKSFRPTTPMPRFFNLANTSDEDWPQRNEVEVEAIVTYLYDESTPIELETAPPGNAARGEGLVASVGCLGCHMVGDETAADDAAMADARFAGYRQFGPNLDGIGSKVGADWLYTWVRNPTHYWDETTMPSLRLTQQEAADVAAYLVGLTVDDFAAAPIPQVDAGIRDGVALEYLQQQMPSVQAAARLAEMDDDETRHYLGERLISRYGCAGCHNIPGFEDAGRIGTSLSNWGSKAITRLDFGLLDLPHERRAFLEQKLRAPRSYDDGRVRSPQEILKMPNFDLTDEEIDAISTALLGFTDQEMLPEAKPAETPERLAIEAGRAIVDDYNCRGCHVIEDAGGAIREVIAERMVATGEVASRPAGLVFGPPNLKSEGARVQPEWLYRFFTEPGTVRPWLQVRMPTFDFDDEQLNALTAYFAALDGAPYPFEEVFTTAHEYPSDLVREGAVLAADQRGSLQCLSCHFSGGREPRVASTQWAPDLALAGERLRPDWIDLWIKDPQQLQPGTNMPQFYPSLDAGQGFWAPLNRDPQTEIDALVAYIMSLGN